MRITTQMLNESARKAGLPVNNTSLLNYIGGTGNNNSLLEALNKKKETAANITQKNNYEKLGKEAQELTQSAQALLQEGENSLFEQAETSGDKEKVYDSIEKLFENYNSILKELRNTSNTLNDFYRQMLTEASVEVKETLEGVGITLGKDGTARVDMEKVKEVDFETLKGLFGAESNFMQRIEFLSTRISDYAKANVESLSCSYDVSGNIYSAISSSRYDLWG